MAIDFPPIDPVALEVGPLVIRWYALAYLAGFLIGWRYALRMASWDRDVPRGLTKTHIDDFIVWAVAGVILGGRIGYILFYQFGMYLENPLEVLKLWHGGMSFHGGAAGVIIAMIIFSWKRKVAVLRLTDIVCACVPIGLFFGRIANFVNGELYGRVTTMPWGVIFPHGGPEPRHASQLYEAVLEGLVLGLILFALMRCARTRNMPGLVSGVFLAGYGIARIIVEFFREPDAQIGYIAQYFTMGQVLCLPMIAGGLYLVIRAFRHNRHDTV